MDCNLNLAENAGWETCMCDGLASSFQLWQGVAFLPEFAEISFADITWHIHL